MKKKKDKNFKNKKTKRKILKQILRYRYQKENKQFLFFNKRVKKKLGMKQKGKRINGFGENETPMRVMRK